MQEYSEVGEKQKTQKKKKRKLLQGLGLVQAPQPNAGGKEQKISFRKKTF